MDTDRESRLWHNGIYEGLVAGFKTHNPNKIYERMKISEYGRKEWYNNDGHYFDIPFVVSYILSTVVEVGLFSVLVSYL